MALRALYLALGLALGGIAASAGLAAALGHGDAGKAAQLMVTMHSGFTLA